MKVHLFLKISEFLYNTVQDKQRVACSLIRPAVSIEHRIVTDRQTDRPGPQHSVARIKWRKILVFLMCKIGAQGITDLFKRRCKLLVMHVCSKNVIIGLSLITMTRVPSSEKLWQHIVYYKNFLHNFYLSVNAAYRSLQCFKFIIRINIWHKLNVSVAAEPSHIGL